MYLKISKSREVILVFTGTISLSQGIAPRLRIWVRRLQGRVRYGKLILPPSDWLTRTPLTRFVSLIGLRSTPPPTPPQTSHLSKHSAFGMQMTFQGGLLALPPEQATASKSSKRRTDRILLQRWVIWLLPEDAHTLWWGCSLSRPEDSTVCPELSLTSSWRARGETNRGK